MKRLLLSAILLYCSFFAFAQNEITYLISFPNIVHHEAEIKMTVPEILTPNLMVRIARSSPGRYATHEFGKNIYNVQAVDANGKALKINQPQTDVYEVVAPGKKATITYTVYGNWVDGTYAGFDLNYAHINTPAVFMFPVGLDKRARIVSFNLSDKPNWKIATQLKPLANKQYYAKDFQYFMDSPIEISDHKTASWSVTDKSGKKQTIHYVGYAPDAQPVIDNFANMVKKVVEEQAAVWGEYPVFDYGNYYFLHSVHPENAGDGMEHRNSTVIVQRQAKIEGNENTQLGTFSHEFFHAWNVERLRPATLEPFNFTRSNVSDGLWIAEGFTQYYGGLTLKRAGFKTLEEAIQTFNGLVNTVLNSPGATNYSPIESSRYAVFADAGVAIDQSNKANIFASYYTYGAAVALALDLRLRADFNLTLDEYMRALWNAYGKTEIAYTMLDLQKTLGSLTKNPSFAETFFKQYVHGTAKNDYAALLAKAGLVLRKSNANRPFTGFGRLTFNKDGAALSTTLKGSPAYNAGLDVGDVLLKINNDELKDQAALTKIMGNLKAGEVVEVSYTHRGQNLKTKLTLAEDPALEIVTIEKTGGELTAEMLSFRNKWLNTQVK